MRYRSPIGRLILLPCENSRARQVLAVAGSMAALAMAASLATTVYILVIAGFFAVGLSLSPVHPLGMSISGDLRPGRAGISISRLFFQSFGSQ
jgi:hypothetical protein